MMQRYDPFRQMTSMQGMMDRLLDDSFLIPAALYSAADTDREMLHRIDLDVVEQGDNLLIKASMPGVKPEDINVTVEKGILTIQGEVHDEHEHGEGRYRHRERHYGSFARSVMLPDDVDADACQADIEHGVLTLTFPKAPHARTQRIPIRSSTKTMIEGETSASGQAKGESKTQRHGSAEGGHTVQQLGNGGKRAAAPSAAQGGSDRPEGSITRP